MKERPILFSAPMVRALLDGSKTQTRRAVKTFWPCTPEFNEEAGLWEIFNGDEVAASIRCPYGQPGDQLWVRESFWGCDLPGYGDQPCVVYDDEWVGGEYQPAEPRPWGRKFGRIPSIHMPRDCSRILLEIVSVRIERLHDISKADAIAEGAATHPDGPWHAYRSLWTLINGAGSWDANPWVWVMEFKRVNPC